MQKPPKYNLTDVMGHFETDMQGNFVIVKRDRADMVGQEYLIDALGRRVNMRGYLVDEYGNIVNKFGDIVVPNLQLDKETQDIPADLFQDLFIPK